MLTTFFLLLLVGWRRAVARRWLGSAVSSKASWGEGSRRSWQTGTLPTPRPRPLLRNPRRRRGGRQGDRTTTDSLTRVSGLTRRQRHRQTEERPTRHLPRQGWRAVHSLTDCAGHARTHVCCCLSLVAQSSRSLKMLTWSWSGLSTSLCRSIT
jgi:hypothetical protein